MKRSYAAFSVIIFLTIFMVSCGPRTYATPEIPMLTEPALTDAPSTGVSLDTFTNMTLVSPHTQATVQLTNGVYDGEANGSPLLVQLLPQAAFGDLSGDGLDDAALLLTENTGGSGEYVSLVAMVNNGTGFDQVAMTDVDDRPLINSIAIENGRVVLDAVIHAVDDPMVEPTMKVVEEYTLEGGKLVRRKLDSTMHEAARTIVIDSPAEAAAVNASFQVTGSMPIAPFENTLSYRIFDASGNMIDQGPFMVTAADMGAPATFNNTLTIPGAVSGSTYRIELEEMSMANGSALCMNSVEVVVK
jgi:hypothetical protein